MAAATVPTPSVVLRVKRKREEDPVEALMISKHARIDPLSTEGSDQSVFKFAGTVPSGISSEELIMEKVRGHSKLVKLNPLASLSLEDSLQQRREQQKISRNEHRYKLVSHQRSLPHPASDSVSECSKQNTENSLCLLDLEKDILTEPSPSPQVGGASLAASSDSAKSEITCNNVTMTRERAPGAPEPQFVYDLYYTQDLSSHGISTIDWKSMCIRECGVELVHDIFDPDDHCYEDDNDDSNDESNWRNDYPDEEDLSPAGSHSDDEDDRNEEYRYRDAQYDSDYGDYYG